MFHLSANAINAVAAAVLGDAPAVNDTVFSTQNNHFIYTDDLRLIGHGAFGVDLTAAQMYSPSLQPFGNFWMPNVDATAAPGNYPRLINYSKMPFVMPKYEQIQQLLSVSAASRATALTWLAPTSWNTKRTLGTMRSFLQLTATPTGTLNTWSGLAPITFTQQPKGGWYVVHAAYVYDANGVAIAFRLFFPRCPGFGNTGRQLRPGSYVTQAVGNLLIPNWEDCIGDWGAFHSFEPLQIEVYGNAAAATALTIYLDVDYLGQADPGGAYPLAA